MTAEELKALAPDGVPTEAFWSLWRERKDALKAAGVRVEKDGDKYIVRHVVADVDKPVQPKLMTLEGVPTLAEFGAMTPEQKVAWIRSNESRAKALGLAVVDKPAFPEWAIEWKGISARTLLSIGNAWLSNKQADVFANALRRLRAQPKLVRNGSGQQVLALWEEWSAMPLNVLKYELLNKSRAGLARYYSPEARARRAATADHYERMRNDSDYAFYVAKSKLRGEYDALRAEGVPLTQRDAENEKAGLAGKQEGA